ncbi:cupin domain-containing protein [Stutzerimonas stutzeri]|uniref:cupin domain-containing protein n=1 Tax=Stutzerimonas stutzeri TaxID=316 RepID=UPI00209C1281|nr:cupin domain-containing protein [Stutzerimonas stutzeri]
MADRLAALMTHFPMRAQVFNTGPLCGINTLQSDGVHGQLHLIRRGAVEVRYGRETLHVTQPSLLLFPRPLTHRFITAPDCEVDMVCANLTFEGGSANPIASALADLVCLPLDGVWGAEPVLSLLFEEAFEQRCGRMALVERLVEVVMIQILRQLMESDEVSGGLLSGLAHPRLRNALVAMHEAPAQDWTLDNLAGVADVRRPQPARALPGTGPLPHCAPVALAAAAVRLPNAAMGSRAPQTGRLAAKPLAGRCRGRAQSADDARRTRTFS